MSQFPNSFSNQQPIDLDYATNQGAVFNFFNAVYAWMCAALAITAGAAWVTAQHFSAMAFLYNRGVSLALMLGLVLFVVGIRAAAYHVSALVATVMFLAYAGLVGMAISGIFVVYQLSSIAGVFVITAGMFGGMSIYGFVTKRDLTTMGGILIMIVWGMFLTILVNIFLQSPAISWAISFIGVFVFAGLTAYDTQKLKQIAVSTADNRDMAARMSILGSLELYLDFLNMFLMLLRLLGNRK